MSSYVECINAFPTGLLFNSPEGPSHELDLEPIGSGTWIFILAHLRGLSGIFKCRIIAQIWLL